MAHELTLPAAPGQTVVAKLMQGGAQVGSDIAMSESAVSGYYSGAVPGGTAAGVYDVLFLAGGMLVGHGSLRWDGAAEVLPTAGADVVEGAITRDELARIVLAGVSGQRAGIGTAEERYFSVDGATVRIAFVPADGVGNGASVVNGA